MIYLVLNLLLMSGLYIAAGVIALVRASKAPSGKGLAFAGGAILVVDGLIVAAWNVWYRVFLYPGDFDPGAAMGLVPLAPWVFPTYQIGYRVLLVIAIALLLFAVLSARGKQAAAQEAPVFAHGGPQGYGPQGYGPQPGQGYPAQQGGPQQHAQQYQQPGGPQQPQQPGEPQQPQQGSPTGPQQGSPTGPQQPQQGNPTGPQNPYQQPPRSQQNPQQPGGPQQPRQGSHRRPPQPPEGGASGPQQPPRD